MVHTWGTPSKFTQRSQPCAVFYLQFGALRQCSPGNIVAVHARCLAAMRPRCNSAPDGTRYGWHSLRRCAAIFALRAELLGKPIRIVVSAP